MRLILELLAFAVFFAAYFGLSYLLLKRAWLIRAGLAMIAVTIIGGIALKASGPILDVSGVVVLLIVPILFIFVGLIVVILDWIGRIRAKKA